MSQEWINLRVDDEKYVLDTIESAKNSKSLDDTWFTDDKETIISVLGITDTDKIGLMGHSLGGAVSVTVGRERDDIDAVIDMDGNMFGEITGIKNGKFEYYTDSYSVPLLALFTENNYNTIEADPDGGLLRVNRVVIDNAKDGKITCFSNAKHMDFTDLPLFSPFLGSMLGHGDVDSEKMMTTVNGIVLDWFNYYLKGEGVLDIHSIDNAVKDNKNRAQ